MNDETESDGQILWTHPIWSAVGTTRGGPRYGELVESVRRVMDASRLARPEEHLIGPLIERLNGIAAMLEESAVDVSSAPADTRVDLPGRGNVSLPPFALRRSGPDGVEAEVTFRTFHLGGYAAHGGQVALLFDELAGTAVLARITGIPRTAYLKVDFRALTPIDRPLSVRTWVERVDGRKLHVRGSLTDGDTLCAELDALFIETTISL